MKKTFLAPCFIFLYSWGLFAQPVDDDLPRITDCVALINAMTVTAPGKAPVMITIVMRDGLITHIGPDTRVPADAYRIQADSLYVYPAFIDAFSYIGLKEPEGERGSASTGTSNRSPRPEVDSEGNPSLEDAGITPFKGIRPSFSPGEKSIADWRAQGFAIAHIVPKGKMIPGKGTITILAGKETDPMLWKENISMFAQWTGVGGAYPATVIGIMAKWRELYHNASQSLAHQTAYNSATSVSRPKYNQAHESLAPVVKKEMPLFFRAPKVKDISRALALQKELGMKMIIADAEEAWYLKDQFKTNGFPLVLSLNLPEDKGKAKEEKSGDKTDTLTTDPEKAAFEKRRAESLKAHYQQAGVLAGENIRFSFGTMSGKASDFQKSIRTMIENGLTFDQALRALTTHPATLLGIEQYCGTIESGKMANVIVSTKPLFEEDAAIRYMIVEGMIYAYDTDKKKKGNAEETAESIAVLEGTWSYSIATPDQRREGKFQFSLKGGQILGTITSDTEASGNEELENIVLDGQEVSFTYDWDMGGQMIEIEFDIKLSGETFDGSVSVGDFGVFPITGQRISKPD